VVITMTARKEEVMSSEDEKLLTKGEVAQLCRVDVRTVDRWRMAGKVPCHRTPSGRVLFRKYDVLTVIAPAKISLRRRER
jgi:predicted site-specific integrase-resolvase